MLLKGKERKYNSIFPSVGSMCQGGAHLGGSENTGVTRVITSWRNYLVPFNLFEQIPFIGLGNWRVCLEWSQRLSLNWLHCTMQLGNLDTDSRNALLHQELSLDLVSIRSYPSEICCTRHEIWGINKLSLCHLHKQIFRSFPCKLFYLQKWVFKQI